MAGSISPLFPHSTGISSSQRKPLLCQEPESFLWGHCRYSALTKTHLNSQTTTGKSLPVFKHLTFQTLTIHPCHQRGVTKIPTHSNRGCWIPVKSSELDFPPLQQVWWWYRWALTPWDGAWAWASIPIIRSGDGQSSTRAWNHTKARQWGGQGGGDASSTHPMEQTLNRADFCFSLLLHRLSFHLPPLCGRNYGINCLVDKINQLQ